MVKSVPCIICCMCVGLSPSLGFELTSKTDLSMLEQVYNIFGHKGTSIQNVSRFLLCASNCKLCATRRDISLTLFKKQGRHRFVWVKTLQSFIRDTLLNVKFVIYKIYRHHNKYISFTTIIVE